MHFCGILIQFLQIFDDFHQILMSFGKTTRILMTFGKFLFIIPLVSFHMHFKNIQNYIFSESLERELSKSSKSFKKFVMVAENGPSRGLQYHAHTSP
jgi:hypothetical protein